MRRLIIIVILATVLGTAFGQSSATTDYAIDAESHSRLPLLTREDMHDEASVRIYD
ncbi:MAG: hypothetical protein HKN13_11745, partial [Rhodothermales bacterium]|nr:hypothetical protein [Rhodothermales bacterium]